MNWSWDRIKPHKTAVDRSMTVLVPVFEYLRKGGPVSVSVLSNMSKKPDRTGLPSTTYWFAKVLGPRRWALGAGFHLLGRFCVLIPLAWVVYSGPAALGCCRG